MKQTIAIAVLFISLSSFAQGKDTTAKQVKDSVQTVPDVFKMELSLPEVNALIGTYDKQIAELTQKRDALIAQAQKQIIKKPK